jgi:hypothetical protein
LFTTVLALIFWCRRRKPRSIKCFVSEFLNLLMGTLNTDIMFWILNCFSPFWSVSWRCSRRMPRSLSRRPWRPWQRGERSSTSISCSGRSTSRKKEEKKEKTKRNVRMKFDNSFGKRKFQNKTSEKGRSLWTAFNVPSSSLVWNGLEVFVSFVCLSVEVLNNLFCKNNNTKNVTFSFWLCLLLCLCRWGRSFEEKEEEMNYWEEKWITLSIFSVWRKDWKKNTERFQYLFDLFSLRLRCWKFSITQ